MTDIIVGQNGFLSDRNGKAVCPFVDSCKASILEFPEAHVILLRLYDHAENAPGQTVPAGEAHQVRMSARTARRLAAALLDAADEMEGIGEPRQ